MNLKGLPVALHVQEGWGGDLLGDQPQYAADIVCLCCWTEWIAIFPVRGNVNRLECPECHEHESKATRYYAGGHWVIETKKRGLVEMEVLDHE